MKWTIVQVWSQEGYRGKWLHQGHGESLVLLYYIQYPHSLKLHIKQTNFFILQVGDTNSQHFVVATQDFTLRSMFIVMWCQWRYWIFRGVWNAQFHNITIHMWGQSLIFKGSYTSQLKLWLRAKYAVRSPICRAATASVNRPLVCCVTELLYTDHWSVTDRLHTDHFAFVVRIGSICTLYKLAGP